ncbi:ankyrin repeat domain-containing protein [Nocardia gipuzkoensis]
MAPHCTTPRDGDVDAIEHLLGTEDVNTSDTEGWTPLHFAAQASRPEAVARIPRPRRPRRHVRPRCHDPSAAPATRHRTSASA